MSCTICDQIERSTYILESEYKTMAKLVPDDHGGWTLFKIRGSEWEWDDSIGNSSATSLIKQADKVYKSQ